MARRWAILVGVAAVGVMALGAQTATSTVGPVDSDPPDLKLSGPKKQSPQDDFPGCDGGWCNLDLKVSCGDEACTARATKGRLTKVKRDKLTPEGCRLWRQKRAGSSRCVGEPSVIEPGEAVHMDGPELSQKSYRATVAQHREVRKALADGKNVQAKVTVRAKDTAGNVATAKRTIRLVK